MAELPQYSFIPPRTAQTLVKWLAGIVAGALVPSIVFTVGWVRNVATIREVDTKIEDQFKLYDPGAPNKADPRATKPPVDGYAFAVAQCRRDADELRTISKQQTALLIELYRIQVRERATDAEHDRGHKAAAAANAVREFDRYVASGMQLDAAFRRALEINPYTLLR